MVIVGGGFAGLACCRALRGTDTRVTMVDRQNHHLFQPLLYQVATAAMSPANVAAPIRKIVGRWKNVSVALGEATAVDPNARTLRVDDRDFPYDFLVLACGMTHAYFGHDSWAEHAPGLKTVDDALEIRRRILLAFETAELNDDEEARKAELTFVVVGGGPTGVEMAGAIKEIAAESIPRDFKRVDTRSARVVLLEGGDRLLAAYPPNLSERAREDLVSLGVEVRLETIATDIDADGVTLEHAGTSERINSRCVIWAAGLKAEPIGVSLGVETDPSGRVRVNHDLSIPGHPNVFVVGDQMGYDDPETGDPVPGVAQGAIQSGRFVGELIARQVRDSETRRRTFHYRDKGMMATIGRARAVARIGKMTFAGFPAWAMWSLVHIAFLIGFRNRLLAMIEWAGLYVFWSRGARLITGPRRRRP